MSKDFYPRPPGGGRPRHCIFLSVPLYFYPRPPGGGRREPTAALNVYTIIFLSTPSGWRATSYAMQQMQAVGNFYPRPPGGGRPGKRDNIRPARQIFLSTPSGWRATYHLFSDCPLIRISIHALRVEGDCICFQLFWNSNPISIHALRVEGDSKNGQSFHLFLRKREKNLPL